jgi:hypothetical protein
VCEYSYHGIVLFFSLCIHGACSMYIKLLFNRMSLYNHCSLCSFMYTGTIRENNFWKSSPVLLAFFIVVY